MNRLAPLLAQPAAVGALPTLLAATDPAALGGQYYGPGGFDGVRGYPQLVRSSVQSYDLALQQQQLWAVSQASTGTTFPV